MLHTRQSIDIKTSRVMESSHDVVKELERDFTIRCVVFERLPYS